MANEITAEEAIRWLDAIKKYYIHGGDEAYDKKRMKAIDKAIKVLEQQPKRCDSCTHSEERDGSNCYECVKGMADNFEAQPTSDDEIIKALKAVRTFHNGNYAPQIDEAIRRLTMKKSAYVQVNLSDERIQKAVAEAVEEMKAEIEAQPSEKCISRQAVIDLTWDWESFTNITRHDGLSTLREMRTKIEDLPFVTPQRPRGKWIDFNWNDGDICRWGIKCSECHTEYKHGGEMWHNPKFCPNCGADMRGENNGNMD